MRLTLQTLLLTLVILFATFTFAASADQRTIIVSYPDTTPDHILDEAKAAILKAGGEITHEYKLIKAFAARATEASVQSVQALGSKYHALVEEDRQVHAADGAF